MVLKQYILNVVNIEFIINQDIYIYGHGDTYNLYTNLYII